MRVFSRLIRFRAQDGRIYHGDAILATGVWDLAQAKQARVISGNVLGKYRVTDEVKDVKTLLSPLAVDQIRTIRCLGLNYRAHADETNMPYPERPILFYKPTTAAGGPFSQIPVAKIAQEAEGLDFECELVVVIGKACSNVSTDEALSYVLGYAVGNDVSHRELQSKKNGGQWGFGKGFDGWAPFGPGIVAPQALPGSGYKDLRISTKVNGRVMQEGTTSDMIFNVEKTISWLSQGTTLQPGDLIMTGTPPGVALGRNPPEWLRDGDMVEVSLQGVGTCSNKVVFAKEEPKL